MAVKLIQTTTVGAGGAASITFSSIPGSYTDLLVVLTARATSTTPNITLNLNGSSSNFTTRYIQSGAGSTSSSTNTTFIGYASVSTDTASSFNQLRLYVTNYAGSTNKNFSASSTTESNGSIGYQHRVSGIWADTSAITSLTLNLANFSQYSVASLYGITKGSGGATVS